MIHWCVITVEATFLQPYVCYVCYTDYYPLALDKKYEIIHI